MIKWLLLLTLLLNAANTMAHRIAPAVAELVWLEGERVELSLRGNLESMVAGIAPEHSDDTNSSPQAADYNRLRTLSTALLAEEAWDWQGWDSYLGMSCDGAPLQWQLQQVTTEEQSDLALARQSQLRFEGQCHDRATVEVNWQGGDIAFKLHRPQGELESAWLVAGSEPYQFTVQGGEASETQNTALTYTVLGFTHILPLGLDHILFVLGIFLLTLRLSSLLWQVTAFTLAHSITLGLTIYGVIEVSAAIVEPLIAASIIYIGIENTLHRELHRARIAVIFLFGLLHGMGFAGVLHEIGLPESQFLLALLTFNIGVELGQLAVIGLGFITVGYWFGQRAWYRQRVVIPASLLIAMVGGWWLLERTVLA
ncbi:HupE/UreJ family protein [Ectothiorhodospiraceae bacterium BW-2]|nr:HupE/UreJ family protein [Ectothiorhodospiraceae bacterium BW-2]